MFSVTVRDHIMVAHSFQSVVFGPARSLHGATFVVDVTFYAKRLTADNIVLDIGRAHEVIKATLAPLNYQNLDAVEAFKGQETTTEFLCQHIFQTLEEAIYQGATGAGSENLCRLKVSLNESHIAAASFEADLSRGV